MSRNKETNTTPKQKATKKGRSKKHSIKKRLPLLAGLLLLGTGAAYLLNVHTYKTRFLPGTTVNGVNVSELSIGEVEQNLDTQASDYSLTLTFLNNQTVTISSSDISLDYTQERALDTILNTQNRFTWIAGALGAQQQYRLTTTVSYDEDALESLLQSLPELDPEQTTAPVDANLQLNGDLRFYIVPEVNGNTINYEELLSAVESALENQETSLNLVTTEGVYETPNVCSTDEALIARRDSINQMLDTTVTYHMSDGTDTVLDDQTTIEWLKINEDGVYVVDEEYITGKAAEYVAKLAAQDDNYGYYRTFSSTNFGTVKLATEDLHGHTIDQEAIAAEIAHDLVNGTSAEHDLTYSVLVDQLDPRFGGKYVEIDILNQRVYFYIGNELYFSCNCVSGTEGSHSTPSGIFSIINMEKGRTLEGYNSDGSLSYSAHVDYWMCFYPHYGLHDASWRSSFGGSIYTYDGSHGCVNLSNSSAAAIYAELELGTPVIVFRGHDDVVTSEADISTDTGA